MSRVQTLSPEAAGNFPYSRRQPASSYLFTMPVNRVAKNKYTGEFYQQLTVGNQWRKSVYSPGPLVIGDGVKPNPFDLRKYDWYQPVGTEQWYVGSNAQWNSSEGPIGDEGIRMLFSWPVTGTPSPTPGLLARATQKFYGKLQESGQWNIEAFETASRLHRKSVDKHINHLDKVSEGVRRRAYNTRKSVDTISSLWLKKQYAWEPAIKGIFASSLQVIQAHLRPVYIKVSESENDTIVDQFTWSTKNGAAPAYRTVKRTIGIKFIVCLKGNPLGVQDFLSLDPANIAWQLLPYSFVVDWCYNVGSWLEQREIATRFHTKFLWGSKTTSWKEDVDLRVHKDGNNAQGFRFYSRGVGGGTHKGFRRELLSQLPRVQAPVIDVSLNSDRLFSLAALLAQRLKVPRWADYVRNFR